MSRFHVVAGAMFAGKTTELQRLLRRAEIAKKRTQVFIPSADTRSDGILRTHTGDVAQAQSVRTSADLLVRFLPSTQVLVVDEAQFFDDALPHDLDRLVRTHRHLELVVAGLVRDYRGVPFPNVAQLLALSDTQRILTAVCVACGDEATFTHRKHEAPGLLTPGGSELYEARCRDCWYEVSGA